MTRDTSDQTSQQSDPVENNFLIVGLGASAGGIHALKEFFSEVPKDSGMAYVVILHMSPEHESHLAEVLQTSSLIPITQVKQRTKVKPNNVYVVPPNQNLAMADGHLALTHMIGSEERRSPVDLFFRTLAETNDSRAVSVILSGTGSNGSMGVKRIKEHGGVAFVQDPNEAQFDDMPRNAIATGFVDYVLPVSEIPEKILSYAHHRGSIKVGEVKEVGQTDEHALVDIFTQLRVRTGHDFSNYKRATMLRRIQRRIGVKEFSGLPEYAAYLRKHRPETQALMKDLLISVTNFFRDPESVTALAQRVLPAIFSRKDEGDQVRVWIAGCATGEEAYTIAMLLDETLAGSKYGPKVQLFATDLDADAIATARDGYYTEAEVADVSPERLRRYFVRDHDGYCVRPELRETVLFAVHNIIKDPPFAHLDLISCRNLLIYLNRTAQARALEVMHFALNPTSYLFLGASESIDGGSDLFSNFDKQHHIFRSRPGPSRASMPIPEWGFRTPIAPFSEKERTLQEVRATQRLSYVELHQRLLEQLAPPSVVINEEYDIVHLSDSAGSYMQMLGGEPTRHLLKLLRPELRLELRTALYQAMRNNKKVETETVEVSTNLGNKNVRMTVHPVLRETDPARGFILIVFEETEGQKQLPEAESTRPPVEGIAHHLEDELIHSRAQLHATVEQYEIQQEELRASNEELQAMNEELRSAAEELETSKEELQSLNEELTTVNQELKIKIEELGQASNDINNLINSTDIATIFLDGNLRVKQFTPRTREVFNLIPADAGRPLQDITHKLLDEDLMNDLQQVLKKLNLIEREVESTDHRWYTVRILPYRTIDDRIDGAVITLVDITESKVAKNELERIRAGLEITVSERTHELRQANQSLSEEVVERRDSEMARLKLLNQLVTVQELERRRLARDLHDQLGQQLTVLRLKLESLKESGGKRGKFRKEIEDLLAVTTQLDGDVDYLAWQLRPPALDDLGLAEALRVYVKQWAEHFNLQAEFHTNGFESQRLAPEIENNLYRVAQEALTNVTKHSQASRVEVLLEKREDHAVLIVEDNGKGFDSEHMRASETLGLPGMRERALLIGGNFEVESTPGKGTTIFVRVPIHDQTEETSLAAHE